MVHIFDRLGYGQVARRLAAQARLASRRRHLLQPALGRADCGRRRALLWLCVRGEARLRVDRRAQHGVGRASVPADAAARARRGSS